MNQIHKEPKISLQNDQTITDWDHLMLMIRIVPYLAKYYHLPLGRVRLTPEDKKNLERFYDAYHIPFQMIVEIAYNITPDELDDCPEQIFMFLSTLAQNYENSEYREVYGEEEAFMKILKEREEQSYSEDVIVHHTNLGMFHQSGETLLIGDPELEKEDPNICRLQVKPGAWVSTAVTIETPESEGEQRVAVLISKNRNECPYSSMQILEQMFYWPMLEDRVSTENGVIGFFDEKYYQTAVVAGIKELPDFIDVWTKSCIAITMDYPYAGSMPHYVVSSTGEGEGAYEVYYLMNKGHIVALAMDFAIYGA